MGEITSQLTKHLVEKTLVCYGIPWIPERPLLHCFVPKLPPKGRREGLTLLGGLSSFVGLQGRGALEFRTGRRLDAVAEVVGLL